MQCNIKTCSCLSEEKARIWRHISTKQKSQLCLQHSTKAHRASANKRIVELSVDADTSVTQILRFGSAGRLSELQARIMLSVSHTPHSLLSLLRSSRAVSWWRLPKADVSFPLRSRSGEVKFLDASGTRTPTPRSSSP
jgi:hypothetical protein